MTAAASRPALIAPVAGDQPRPLWSVMIPTYNCANYLRQTLQSVLAQNFSPADMQIEVVDDGSTKDDPEAVVREVGKGRVAFYRQPKNLGATANFNSCLERSRGHLVHVLHGDDYVAEGFYPRFTASFSAHPDCALALCRAIQFETPEHWIDVTPLVTALAAGSRDSSPIWYGNYLRTPAAVVRRSFYEQHGGFDPSYAHVADWEMWERCIRLGGGIQIDAPLAHYRIHPGSDTNRLARQGLDHLDYLNLATHFAAHNAGYDLPHMRRHIADRALLQARRFQALNDPEAYAANFAFWLKCTTPTERCVVRLHHFLTRKLEALRLRTGGAA